MNASIRTLKAHREQLEAQKALIVAVANKKLERLDRELDKTDEKIAEQDAKRIIKEIIKYNKKESK